MIYVVSPSLFSLRFAAFYSFMLFVVLFRRRPAQFSAGFTISDIDWERFYSRAADKLVSSYQFLVFKSKLSWIQNLICETNLEKLHEVCCVPLLFCLEDDTTQIQLSWLIHSSLICLSLQSVTMQLQIKVQNFLIRPYLEYSW